MAVEIRPVTTRRELRAFIALPWQLYRNEPKWVAPLLMDLKKRLDQDKNHPAEGWQRCSPSKDCQRRCRRRGAKTRLSLSLTGLQSLSRKRAVLGAQCGVSRVIRLTGGHGASCRARGENNDQESDDDMKQTTSGSKEGEGGDSPSQLIDARIRELGDWRGEALARVRAIVKQADPGVVEEWKWRGVPVWTHAGIICTGETYKNAVKMTFAKGASLEDPSGLFNSSLDGNTRRAIDFHQGEEIDEEALNALIREAVALNTSSAAQRRGTRA